MTLVHLAGELDKLTSETVRSELDRSVASGDVVLDLSEVSFLDSAGLHVLFRLARTLGESGSRLGVVVPPTSPVRRVIEIAHVAGAAVVCRSVDDCVLRLRRVSAPSASGSSDPVET